MNSFMINEETRNIFSNINKIKNETFLYVLNRYINQDIETITDLISKTKYENKNLKGTSIMKLNSDRILEIKKCCNISASNIIGVFMCDYINMIKINEPDIYEVALDDEKVEKYLLERNPKRKYILKERVKIVKKDFDNFKYEEKELDLLNENIKLSEDDILKIEKLNYISQNRKYNEYLRDMYILYKIYNYSTVDLGIVYGLSGRTLQNVFKKCDITRSLTEAQQIAKEKRNYKEIMNKGIQTRLDNNCDIEGSEPEKYTRELLNAKLPLEFPNVEIIVGLNNKSILENGKEIDIPIIIIDNNGNILKLAIEYNGDFWHKDNEIKDGLKRDMIKNRNYHVFYFCPKTNATSKQIKEYISNEIEEAVIPFIKERLIL